MSEWLLFDAKSAICQLYYVQMYIVHANEPTEKCKYHIMMGVIENWYWYTLYVPIQSFFYIFHTGTVRSTSPMLVHVYLHSHIGTVRSTSPMLVHVYLHYRIGTTNAINCVLYVNTILLLYSSVLHQHTDDNVPGTDVATLRVRGSNLIYTAKYVQS